MDLNESLEQDFGNISINENAEESIQSDVLLVRVKVRNVFRIIRLDRSKLNTDEFFNIGR